MKFWKAKVHMMSAAAFFSVTMFAYQSLAQSVAADEKFKNGVPFKQLSEEIESNATAIDNLNATTAELRSDLDALTVDFKALEERVAVNETSITGIKTDIASLDTRIQGNLTRIGELDESVADNATEIASLKTQVEADFAALKDALNQLRTELDAEKAELDAFIAQVETAQAATDTQIQSLSTEINSIQAKLAAKADITLVEQTIANLHINDLQSQMLGMMYEINSTKDRLTRTVNRFCNHTHYYYATSSHVHQYCDLYSGGSTCPYTFMAYVNVSGNTYSPQDSSSYGSCFY
jgi:chromosome segregation ATPase